MNKGFAAMAALGLVATAAPAKAQEGTDIIVTYDDLDLDTTKGQKELDRRIEKAARQVCGLDRQRTGTRIGDHKATECLAYARNSTREYVAAAIASAGKGG